MNIFKEVHDNWTIEETTRIFGLKLHESASISAPPGKQVTMTFNGVNLPIIPGTYEGDIVLTVTDDIPVHAICDEIFRAAVYVNDGKLIESKSVTDAVACGTLTDSAAEGISIESHENNFNGIFVDGSSEYTVNNAQIHFSGNGDNDFIGQGAGVMAGGKATLNINNSHITSYGAARNTIFGGNSCTLNVNNCTIEARPGVLAADYVDSIEPGGMKCVPWMLGLRGNCRATNLADNTTAYFNNCTLKSESWGVMSTDGVSRVRSYIKDSAIEITGASGYGAFALLDCVVTLDNTTVKVPDYGLVSSMGSAGFIVKNNTKIDSGRFGTISYRVADGLIKIEEGCAINTGEATFMIKGCPNTYEADKALLNPANGIILQMIDTDDPFNPKGSYSQPVGEDSYIAGRDLTTAQKGADVFASFSNMPVNGDFYNATSNLKFEFIPLKPLPGEPGGPPIEPMPDGSMPKISRMMGNGPMNLHVSFKNAAITGVITASKADHRVPIIDKTNCEELGEVINTPCAPINNGVIVSLDGNSVWNVTGVSFLTSLTIEKNAVISAPSGKTAKMTVNGVETPIAEGIYTGLIVISPV